MSRVVQLEEYARLTQKKGPVESGYQHLVKKQRQCVTAVEYVNFLITLLAMVSKPAPSVEAHRELRTRFEPYFNDFVGLVIAESQTQLSVLQQRFPDASADACLALTFFLVLTAQPWDEVKLEPTSVPLLFRNTDQYLFEDSAGPRNTLRLLQKAVHTPGDASAALVPRQTSRAILAWKQRAAPPPRRKTTKRL